MKKCNKCHTEYNRKDSFCRKCGRQLKKSNTIFLNIVRYIFGGIFVLGSFLSFSEGIKLYLIFSLFLGISLMPCLYTFLKNKTNIRNDKMWVWIQIILPLLFATFLGVYYPVYVKIVESAGSCEYVKQFDIESGTVFFYCLDKVEIKQDDDSYLELKKLYDEDKDIVHVLISKLEKKLEYVDNSALYADNFYSILKCSNGDYVFGDRYMTFKKGFCGVEKVPKKRFNEKTSTSSSSEKENDNKKDEDKIDNKKEKYSNLKNITDKMLKKNFIAACNQSNIKVDKISFLEKIEDWNNGPRYTFTYKNNTLILYALDNGDVSSITVANKNLDKVYLDGYEALDIEDFLVDLNDISEMQIKAENSIKSILNHPNTADFKWFTAGDYGRSYDVYTISGKFEAKNSFNVEIESTFYIEMKRQNGVFEVVYMVVDNQNYIGSKSQIKEIIRKEVVKDEESESGEIVLKDGVKGIYGKEDLFDGNKYIRYYLPSGTYKVEALVKNAIFYLETKKIHKNSSGFDEADIIEKVVLSKIGDKKEITITDDACILLVAHTQIKLIKK